MTVIGYFCERFMKKTTHISVKHKVSGIIMILALAWLTVSIPFVYAAQQKVAAEIAASDKTDSDSNSDNNPFANTTEEKTPSGPNTLSEYLHETHSADHQIVAQRMHIHHIQVATYIAFHGELTGPPPKA